MVKIFIYIGIVSKPWKILAQYTLLQVESWNIFIFNPPFLEWPSTLLVWDLSGVKLATPVEVTGLLHALRFCGIMYGT